MKITTEEMEVRIRLPRIAVVISSHTTNAEYLRVIEFLSLVRGGQYPANPCHTVHDVFQKGC